MMLVSVVIPTYNSEKYIKDSIESVLNQTHKDIELIIVDDGSIDNTRNIVESIGDQRLKYFYQENAGPSAARNYGINHSTGDYIAFLDSDDVWLSHKIEKQLLAFDQNENLVLVFTDFEASHEGKNKKYFQKYKNFSPEVFQEKLLIDYDTVIPYPSTVLVKKSALKNAGLFDTSIICGEDWDLWIKLTQYGDFHCLQECLTIRIIPKQSITSTVKLERTEEYHNRILNGFFNSLNSDDVLLNLKSKAFCSIYFNLALAYFYRNNYGEDLNKIIDLLKQSYNYDSVYFRAYSMNKARIKFFIKLVLKYLSNQILCFQSS